MADRWFEKKEHASLYSKFRPLPPQEITDKIIEYLGQKIAPPYKYVLDVGCGTGQSSHIWRPYFQKITGSDVSPAQIEEAKKDNEFENVDFIVCPSEKIPLPNNCAEMISVVTALHWFDFEEFFKEAKRLLVKNGVLAVQSYHKIAKLKLDTEEKTNVGNALLKQFFYDNIARFFPSKLETMDNEYRSINFPFSDLVRYSGIKSSVEVTLDAVIGFFSTYSPYQKLKEAEPEKAESSMKQLREKLSDLAGGENKMVTIEWDNFLILCRNN